MDKFRVFESIECVDRIEAAVTHYRCNVGRRWEVGDANFDTTLSYKLWREIGDFWCDLFDAEMRAYAEGRKLATIKITRREAKIVHYAISCYVDFYLSRGWDMGLKELKRMRRKYKKLTRVK